MIVQGNKEEAKMLQRCLNSIASHVDGIFITLTNPDKTKLKETEAICKNYGVNTSYFKWVKDFSAARNFNFSQVPDTFEWIFWLDVDDVIRRGDKLKESLDIAIKRGADSVFYNYLYQVELGPDGKVKNILIEHLRERLVKNNGSYKWVGPIHETLIEQRPTVKIEDDRLDIVHLSQDDRRGQAIHRNIEILEKQVKDTKRKDPRPIYYLAKAYYDLHTPEHHANAEPMLLEYLKMSGWAEERSQAWEYLGAIHLNRKHLNKALKAFFNSMIEDPKFPSVWFNIALTYIYKQDYDRALFWVKAGTQLPMPKSTLVTNPRDLAVKALEVVYNASLKKSQLDEAWAAAIKLQEFFPGDESVAQRVKFCADLRKQRELTMKFSEIAKHLSESGESGKLKPLMNAVPTNIVNNPFMIKLHQKVVPKKTWGEDEITIFCGPGFTNWSPKKIAKPGESFLGGSEEAVVYMSRELAKLGWKVTVYADPGDDEGEHEGVNWLPYYKLNPQDHFNIMIAWRNIGFADADYDMKRLYIWCHDVINPLDVTKERLAIFEKLIVLSPAHRKNIPDVSDEKIFVSTNGYHEHFPEIKPNNDPYKCIWTSSYDRGLQHLLNIWPDVMKEVPKAELHVFYGWDLFARFYRDNPERMAWKDKIDHLLQQPGVTHHARVPQPELEKWHKKCGVWAYPTHFYEINCISGIKAQLWGNVPVVMDYAALNTTVKYGTKVKGEIYDPKVKEEFKNALVRTLKDHKWQDEQRKLMMPWVREKFHWSKVAKSWSDMFKGTNLNEAARVILKHDKKLGKYLPIGIQKENGVKESY